MRTALVAAAVFGIGIVAGGVAAARVWNDPQGRLTFETPDSWRIDQRQSEPATLAIAFDPSHDCYIMATPNQVTANSSARAVIRSTMTPFTEESWVRVANSMERLFPESSARLVSQSVDASMVWPIQRAEFESPSGPVSAAIQARPGLDLMAFCTVVGGSNPAVFETIFRSIGHPNDAAWEATLQPEPAAPATAPGQ